MDIIEIVRLTFMVTGTALFLSVLLGGSLGFYVVLNDFPGKKLLIILIHTGMGFPPVVVGLLVLICLWRGGPLGFLELIYTPAAMIIAQTILATPIIAGLTMASIQQVPQKMKWQAMALGARGWNLIRLLIKETRRSLWVTVMAGFGRIISEVGAVILVGGNIKGQTRVLTTAIVLESQQGDIRQALVLGIILIALSFSVNLGMTLLQQRIRR